MTTKKYITKKIIYDNLCKFTNTFPELNTGGCENEQCRKEVTKGY